MKKLLFYIGLCTLGVLNSSSAYAPVASLPCNAITVRVGNVTSSHTWAQNLLLELYPVVPVDISESPPVRVISHVVPRKAIPHFDNPEFQSLYEETISFIKYHEGFAGGKAYYCVAGYKTIGYGHVVKPGEDFPEQISRREADRLLRRDFNRSIQSALKYSPHLTGCRLLAVAHFCFAKGPGNYERSTLRKLINSGQDPSEEFLRWCKYHKPDGRLVKSSYSRKIREWEVQMYNRVHAPSTINPPDNTPDNDVDQNITCIADSIVVCSISEI